MGPGKELTLSGLEENKAGRVAEAFQAGWLGKAKDAPFTAGALHVLEIFLFDVSCCARPAKVSVRADEVRCPSGTVQMGGAPSNLKARIGVRPVKISGTMEPVLHGR